MNFLKRLYIIIFFYAILEGSVRKWIALDFDFEIILFRDMLIFFCVIYGFHKKIYDFTKFTEKFLIFYTLLVFFWGGLQLIINSTNFFVYFIGLRNWILYVWFAILFFRCFDKKNFFDILKIILLTIIPLSILSIFQHYLPIDHFVNAQTAYSELGYVIYPDFAKDTYIAFVTPGIARVSSTFSYHYGYSQYLKFLFPLIILLIENSEFKSNFSNKTKLLILSCFFLAIIYSGSRQTILFSIFILFVYLVLSIHSGGIYKFLRNIAFMTIIFYIFSYFTDRPLEAIQERFRTASESVGITSRLIDMLFGTNNAWENFTFLGKGIGMGSNITSVFFGNTRFILGEFENDRMLGEGGLIGILLILLKFIFSFAIFFSTLKIFYEKKEIFPFIFSLFIIQQLTLVQISAQLTTQIITFMGLGLFLSTLYLFSESKKNK